MFSTTLHLLIVFIFQKGKARSLPALKDEVY